MNKTNNDLRWVYGTRTNKWYLVDSKDRDYNDGITQELFNRIGEEAAKAIYLSPKLKAFHYLWLH